MISDTCRALLVHSQRFATSYGSGFFNHLPMALLALERLGGDDARLRDLQQAIRLGDYSVWALHHGDHRMTEEATLYVDATTDLRYLSQRRPVDRSRRQGRRNVRFWWR